MAVLLAGTSDGINLPGPVTVTKNRSQLMGMGWVRYNQILAANTKMFGYSTGASATASRFTIQWVPATPGQIRVAGRALDVDPQCFLESSTVLTRGPWFHIAAGIDYAKSLGWIFINGVLDTSGPLTNTLGAAATENTNSLAARWGCHEGTGAGDQGMAGLLEDARLYSRILSADEVMTIYTEKGKDGDVQGLLHRYPFNDGGDGVAVASCACISNAERIVGGAVGTPEFAPGITVSRRRRRNIIGKR